MIIKPAAAPARPASAVEFTEVADVLDLAVTLVRTRGELGETSSRDKRPRIRHAIDRAATLTSIDPTRVAATRQWAALLAAEHVNLTCGRGRRRDHLDLPASHRTLDGFGLDIGTIGAVNLAADLLTEAARTARRITAATPIPVHGHGPVTAYRLDGLTAPEVDIDDIIPVTLNPATRSGELVNARIRDIKGDGHGYAFLLHLPVGQAGSPSGVVTADHGWRGHLYLPAPHLPLPWQTVPATHA